MCFYWLPGLLAHAKAIRARCSVHVASYLCTITCTTIVETRLFGDSLSSWQLCEEPLCRLLKNDQGSSSAVSSIGSLVAYSRLAVATISAV